MRIKNLNKTEKEDEIKKIKKALLSRRFQYMLGRKKKEINIIQCVNNKMTEEINQVTTILNLIIYFKRNKKVIWRGTS